MAVVGIPPGGHPGPGLERLPDTRALAVAELLQVRVHPHPVYLFGSRARGDWAEHSDIDLMVLSEQALSHPWAQNLASRLEPDIVRLFGKPVEIQVFHCTFAEFAWGRTSPNHLAGGVQRDGLSPEGEPMPPISQNNPWPDTQQCLRVARRSLHAALKAVGNQEDYVGMASVHHALENGLKAYASACGLHYDKTHRLENLVAQIQTQERMIPFPAQPWLKALSDFRKEGPYLADYPLPFPAQDALTVVQTLCGEVAARALELCRKIPADVSYDRLHFAGEDLSQPLGGIETAALASFQVELQVAAARDEGWNEGRVATQREALLDIARLLCDTDQLVAFQQELEDTPWTDWPDIQAVYWRFRPGQGDGGD